jgi:hypothetical protein
MAASQVLKDKIYHFLGGLGSYNDFVTEESNEGISLLDIFVDRARFFGVGRHLSVNRKGPISAWMWSPVSDSHADPILWW